MSSTWQATTAYGLGAYVEPTVVNGYKYEVTTAGTSNGTEPSPWGTTIGGTTTDGTVTWTCRALADFDKPGLSSKSVGFLDEIKDIVRQAARMFQTDKVVANYPDGCVRYNESSNKFQVYSSGGGTWSDLDLSGQTVGTATEAAGAVSTFAKADLPASVAYEDEANVFTSAQRISNTIPTFYFYDTDAALNEKLGSLQVESGAGFSFATYNDDGSGGATRVAWSRAGVMTSGTIPLARMMRAEYTGTGSTLDLGTVAAGDRILITYTGTGTDSGAPHKDGNPIIYMSSGSATIPGYVYGAPAIAESAGRIYKVQGIIRVTGGGTLVLSPGFVGTGSTVTWTSHDWEAIILMNP